MKRPLIDHVRQANTVDNKPSRLIFTTLPQSLQVQTELNFHARSRHEPDSNVQYRLLRHYSSVRTDLPSNMHCLTFTGCCVVVEESCLLSCPVVLCTTTWKISVAAARWIKSRQRNENRPT